MKKAIIYALMSIVAAMCGTVSMKGVGSSPAKVQEETENKEKKASQWFGQLSRYYNPDTYYELREDMLRLTPKSQLTLPQGKVNASSLTELIIIKDGHDTRDVAVQYVDIVNKDYGLKLLYSTKDNSKTIMMFTKGDGKYYEKLLFWYENNKDRHYQIVYLEGKIPVNSFGMERYNWNIDAY